MSGNEATSAALHAELERLRTITQSVGVAIAHLDRERRYVWANEDYGRLVDRRPDAIVGRTLAEVIGGSAACRGSSRVGSTCSGDPSHCDR